MTPAAPASLSPDAGPDIGSGAGHWAAVAALVVLGLAMRAWAFDAFAVHHPDEVFQYLEQAHRRVFGYGVTPWEYRYGIRSWLVPLALSVPMRWGGALDPGGLGWLLAPRVAMAAFAATAMGAAYAIGVRWSRAHALAALAVSALWVEAVYFGVHGLTETLATTTFLLAVAVEGGTRGRLAATGALLALCAVLRLQYAPAVAVYALLRHGSDPRRWPWLAAGGAEVLALSAGVDATMGQAPFGWAVGYVTQNVVKGRAAGYGVEGPFAYLVMLARHWGPATAPIAILAALGARGRAPLAAAAAANLLLHSLIAHKEYRFILLTGALVLLLAALGTVDLLARLRPGRRALALALALGGWGVASAALAASPPMTWTWRRFDPQTRLIREAGRLPGLCGVALYGDFPWASGGYTYLHNPAPIYLTQWEGREALSPRDLPAASAAFDVILAGEDHARDLPPAYAPVSCRPPEGAGEPRLCLYRRPGGCDPKAAPAWRLEVMLLRHDA